MAPHPLAPLSEEEFLGARDAVTALHKSADALFFRSIYLAEPTRADLAPFLEAEHAGSLDDAVKRPPRCAHVEYDVIGTGQREYTGAVVDVETKEVVSKTVVDRASQPYFTG